ncbi:MAG: apolipoprotein N-acyltransferase [Chitinophagaceae bacterium]
MKRYTNLLLAIASGLLLFAAWPVSPFTILIFLAWTPLLWIETKVISRKKFFGYTYITMFVWNIATTWWIWNASAPGAIAAFLANSLLMCFPWLGYTIVKKKLGQPIGYIALLAFWMCFEFIHLQDWGLSWPWLTLGNAFASHPEWVQWYDITGTAGGSFWVLASNILLFSIFITYQKNGRTIAYFKQLFGWILLMALPFLYRPHVIGETEKAGTKEIVIVQPNIDPYEKVSELSGSFESQLHILISTTEKHIDDQTDLVIWPETALYNASGIDETSMKENYFLRPLFAFLQKHPNATLLTGIESYRELPTKTKHSHAFNGHYFETYNGAVLSDSTGAYSFYHKSKLVPGVETLPWFLHFLDKWFEKFGGTTAGYASQKERIVMETKNNIKIAPAICYESIYGSFISRYFQNGANLLCIITNDGWWKNTPGHKQHMDYARLRAIENRTWVARSANTGISCFIDPFGKVYQPQPYNTNAAIKMKIDLSQHKETFYEKHGDLLYKIMLVLSVLLIGWTIVVKILRRFAKKKK